ncbi:MAG: NAD(P)-dependent oxidoreductase [Bacillota bacterium]|nr:NAD(P)-dependent oxidoreductase [Bacillota bacterium]
MRVLVTCPPMLGMLEEFVGFARERGLELVGAEVVQVLTEDALQHTIGEYDGWVAGDDAITRKVLSAGRAGRLRGIVKWGIGVDNVDFSACRDLDIHVCNTPQMFGGEVADVALAYLIGLTRGLFFIDRHVRSGSWPKPPGDSIAGKKVGLVGLGDIGSKLARRLSASELLITGYDPNVEGDLGIGGLARARWPESVPEMDFLVFTCSLNADNRHMLNEKVLEVAKWGVFVVNVARGGLIDETALIRALQTGQVRGAALDVFETEPLPLSSPLLAMQQCILGSHNASNTHEGVRRASEAALTRLAGFLNG